MSQIFAMRSATAFEVLMAAVCMVSLHAANTVIKEILTAAVYRTLFDAFNIEISSFQSC